MNNENPASGIKAWAEEDRPREKLRTKGKQALTDSELLAILLGSGSVGQNVLELSKEILQKSNNDLNALGKRSIKDLMKHKGIGMAKAITITAALELGRRRQMTAKSIKPKISSSQSAVDAIGPLLMDLAHEEFWILILNRANTLTHQQKVSSGGMSATVVDLKILFKHAIEHEASGLILVHNHPSGNRNPSEQDKQLTQRVKQAATTLDIRLLDHIIIAQQEFFSFADNGIL